MEPTPDAPLQTRVVDDKSPIIIPWILSRIAEYKKQHLEETNPRPFIVGLNGVQGVGKTTLVRALAQTLQEREGLPTLVVSIDDFYLTHADQLALAAAHPDNALVQHRGEPGTHDIPLLTTFLDALQFNAHPVPIPQYDKSAFSGLGDRAPPSTWPSTSPANPPRVLILEGWCVGFRPLDPADLSSRWSAGSSSRTLHKHKLEHLQLVNERLADYDRVVNGALDAFVHIDAEDTEYVYAWRAEQEAQLWREKGSGMTEEQVVRFVDAYYPAYELYTDGVRRGVFEGVPGRQGCQLRVVVGRDRAVVESMVI
ncbi:P-loop containing nucleoside triphosphate hydrolase protein [Corynascus similis CBS 632.67]